MLLPRSEPVKRESHSHFSGTTLAHSPQASGDILGLIFKFIISIITTVNKCEGDARNLLLHRIYGNEFLDFRKFNSWLMGW